MRFLRLAVSLALFPAFLSAQEIKTKVSESQFDVKPDAVKEEEFDEANTFAYAGIGWGRRTGTIMTGFTSFRTNKLDLTEEYVTTTYDVPHRNGVNFNLGFRHFLKNRFGFGLSSQLFRNQATFNEDGFFNDIRYRSTANTLIFDFMAEGLYRHYLTSSKTGFVYGGLGIGLCSMLQNQTYRDNRKTQFAANFILVRPMLGINLPVYDVFHVFAETGYSWAEGTVSYGDLSLSRFSGCLGLHIRLNSF